MSRGLQWVLGISAVVGALVIVLAVVGPWVFPLWFGRGYGQGMMGSYGQGMMGAYGQGMTQAPAPWAGVGGGGMMGGGGAPWSGRDRKSVV